MIKSICIFSIGTALVVAPNLARAQSPDVRLRLEGYLSYESGRGLPTTTRLFDSLGHFSTVNITLFLETGFKIFLAQKLQHIHGDPDDPNLDEAYVEDERIWKLGRQYLPFGGGLMRECVLAARAETGLLAENVRIVGAYCDAGPTLQHGFVFRVGGNFGLSAAIGQHFGINSTALALVRKLDATPGAGFGWKQVYGVDYSIKTEKIGYAAEIVSLQDGETAADKSKVVSDVSATYVDKRNRSTITAGWSRDSAARSSFYRLAATVTANRNVIFEPMVRFRDKSLFDLTVTTHLKF